MRLTTNGAIDAANAGSMLVMDFTDCPDAQGKLLRVQFDLYVATGDPFNTTIALQVDKGGWYYNVFVANNQNSYPTSVYNPSSNGGIGYQNITAEVGTVDYEDQPCSLVTIDHGFLNSGTYEYDLTVFVVDGATLTPLDATGATIRLTDSNATLVTANPIGDGLIAVESGGGPDPAPACFWTDLSWNLVQDCESAPPDPGGCTVSLLTAGSYWSYGDLSTGSVSVPNEASLSFNGYARNEEGDTREMASTAMRLTVNFGDGVDPGTIVLDDGSEISVAQGTPVDVEFAPQNPFEASFMFYPGPAYGDSPTNISIDFEFWTADLAGCVGG